MTENTKELKPKIRKGRSADLTEGPLFKKMLAYTVPIICTGVLQLLFNAADMVVVGRYASDTALAAVGSTGALINLIVNLIIGLSVGTGVCVARSYGSKDMDGLSEYVHTSLITAVVGGLLFGMIGFFFARFFLELMGSPANVIEQSSLYVRIYFVGIPFTVVYNFSAAILRSVGDTKRPLFILCFAGVVNVLSNLFFVLVCDMDVAGVAWATAISQFLSCIIIVIYLFRVDDCHRLSLSKLKFNGYKFTKIVQVGLPAGVQGSLFSVSNVLIQSSINSFGDVVMSGNAAAANIEGFIYTSMNAFHQTALAFTGQHIGAGKIKRIRKILLLSLASVSVIGLILGTTVYTFGRPLLGIYADGRDLVISYGLIRFTYVATTYFLCGMMDVMSGVLRGMGYSLTSMLITLVSVCGLRVLWVFTVFAKYQTLPSLYISYPISWGICVVAQLLLFVFAFRRMKADAESKVNNQ